MKWLKRVLLALLFSLALGLAIGTALRLRLEPPVYYLGSATAPDPLDVGDTRASIFDASHHEEQVGKPIQVAEDRVAQRFHPVERDRAAFGSTTNGSSQVQGRRCTGPAGQDETLQGLEFSLEGIDARFEPFDRGIFQLWNRGLLPALGVRRSQLAAQIE